MNGILSLPTNQLLPIIISVLALGIVAFGYPKFRAGFYAALLGLGAMAVFYSEYFTRTLQTGQAPQQFLPLALLLLGGCALIGALSHNGFTSKEMAICWALVVTTLLVGIAYNLAAITAIVVLHTFVLLMALFGLKNMQNLMQEGKLERLAPYLRWALTICCFGILLTVDSMLLSGNLKLEDLSFAKAKATASNVGNAAQTAVSTAATTAGKTARAAAGSAAPTPQPTGPRMATQAEQDALNACYTFNAEKYTITVHSRGKPMAGSSDLPVGDLWMKIRAYSHGDLEVTFREGVTYRIPWCLGSKL